MGTPSTPPGSKTVRVSAENHARLNRLATALNGTVDDAVNWLFNREDMVRVPVPESRKDKWQEAAREAALSLPEFIASVTEAAVVYGTDRGTMHLMYKHITEVRNLVRDVHAMAREATTR